VATLVGTFQMGTSGDPFVIHLWSVSTAYHCLPLL